MGDFGDREGTGWPTRGSGARVAQGTQRVLGGTWRDLGSSKIGGVKGRGGLEAKGGHQRSGDMGDMGNTHNGRGRGKTHPPSPGGGLGRHPARGAVAAVRCQQRGGCGDRSTWPPSPCPPTPPPTTGRAANPSTRCWARPTSACGPTAASASSASRWGRGRGQGAGTEPDGAVACPPSSSLQVCHHPPISACHAESDNFIFWQGAC